MEDKKYNQPAFPRPYSDNMEATGVIYSTPITFEAQDGMLMIDVFAKDAMNGIIIREAYQISNPAELVRQSYQIAAAMMEERKSYIK